MSSLRIVKSWLSAKCANYMHAVPANPRSASQRNNYMKINYRSPTLQYDKKQVTYSIA